MVTLDPPVSAIGKECTFTLQAADEGSGLGRLRVWLVQGAKTVSLIDQRAEAGNRHQASLPVRLVPAEHGLSEGPAKLYIEVRDLSWRHWFHGNRTRIERDTPIDNRPPRIEILSSAHNINQGGCGLVIYRVSEPCPVTGVTVGETFYPGHAGLFEDRLLLTAFVAVAYDQGKDTPITVNAEDAAGNRTRSGLRHLIRPKAWRRDVLQISDNFLNSKIPELAALVPAAAGKTPLEQFLMVNRELRQANFRQILELTKTSDDQQHWHDTFLRLPQAANRAMFADQRFYHYQDKEIDHQVHMGVDLASLAASPVPAGNRGRVVFAGELGIYGQTVILDHGMGLFSMYSHLSQMDVQPEQMIERGDILGRTGATGLAGGDHLHYGMMLGGTFVNPIEWWDPHWIRDNVTDKIKAAGEPKQDAPSPEIQQPGN